MAVRVKLWSKDGDEVLNFSDVEEFDAATGRAIVRDEDAADFLSLISDDTYGKPPLITRNEKTNEPEALARPGMTVLYVNSGAILAMLVERTS
jgi:hypothetical protein